MTPDVPCGTAFYNRVSNSQVLETLAAEVQVAGIVHRLEEPLDSACTAARVFILVTVAEGARRKENSDFSVSHAFKVKITAPTRAQDDRRS
jgi:hypothetical protein